MRLSIYLCLTCKARVNVKLDSFVVQIQAEVYDMLAKENTV